MSSQSLSNLKEDIKLLEKNFSKKIQNTQSTKSEEAKPSETFNDQSSISKASSHSCFRLITGSIDELVCELIDLNNNKKYRINANICVKIFF